MAEKKRDALHSLAKDIVFEATVLKHIHEIRTNGFTVIENYYSADRCENIKNDINAFQVNHPLQTDFSPGVNDVKIWAGEKKISSITPFYADPLLLAIANCYLNYPTINYTTQTNCYTPNAVDPEKGAEWHRDSEFEKQIKAIMYLSDVGPDNAPYAYIANSHRISNVTDTAGLFEKKTDFPHLELLKYLEGKRKLTLKTLTAKAGSVILTDTMGIHRRSPIRAGSRHTLTNYYVGEHRKSDFDAVFSAIIKKFN